MALKWKLSQNPANPKDGKEVADPARRTGFTFRIAKVFSKSQECKKRVEQTAPFLGLPYELLEQIFDAVRCYLSSHDNGH